MLQSDYSETVDSPPAKFVSGDQTNLGHRELESDGSADAKRQAYFEKKNRRERFLGAVLLVPATPVICICWFLVRLTSKGPGLFRQTRVGYLGEEFQVLKLRTMRIDAEANGPQWSNSRDPRVTRLGRLYRKLHLDELPQLFNVVRGEMVLTGPRPERPEFVHLLAKEIPNYEERLSVKPGITGLAQVNLPPDSDLESVEKKQTLDLHYIETATFWFDQRLLASTAFRVLLIRGQKVNNALGVNKQHLVDHFSAHEDGDGNGSTMLSELLHRAPAKSEWEDEQIGDSEQEQIHGEQIHGEQIHGEQIHGEQIHGEHSELEQSVRRPR
jgi:lipopolysaccharide/colanic/teichoic acid biosynthesis glycosyltransferase